MHPNRRCRLSTSPRQGSCCMCTRCTKGRSSLLHTGRNPSRERRSLSSRCSRPRCRTCRRRCQNCRASRSQRGRTGSWESRRRCPQCSYCSSRHPERQPSRCMCPRRRCRRRTCQRRGWGCTGTERSLRQSSSSHNRCIPAPGSPNSHCRRSRWPGRRCSGTCRR